MYSNEPVLLHEMSQVKYLIDSSHHHKNNLEKCLESDPRVDRLILLKVMNILLLFLHLLINEDSCPLVDQM